MMGLSLCVTSPDIAIKPSLIWVYPSDMVGQCAARVAMALLTGFLLKKVHLPTFPISFQSSEILWLSFLEVCPLARVTHYVK